MTDLLTPATALPQVRRLVTEVPGPRSRELFARRNATVSAGVSTTLPVFVERAGGGVLVDVDGNSLIDLGSGIAVVSVGNAAPRVVAAVQDQVAAFTHTCFMVTPYEGYVAVCEELARVTPGDHADESGRGGRGRPDPDRDRQPEGRPDGRRGHPLAGGHHRTDVGPDAQRRRRRRTDRGSAVTAPGRSSLAH